LSVKVKKKGYWILFALSILLTILAVKTVLPDSEAGKESGLGYRACCSFAPWSTLILLFMTMINCKLRKNLLTYHTDENDSTAA
jgi:heme/copper-type cytochrome/quinol oxidase subunit 4